MAKRVLIVEDEASVLEVFEEFFKILGMETTSARDGEEGLRIFLEEGPFDLYLIDLKIPKIEGLVLANKIREKDPEGPIFVFSGMPQLDKEKIEKIPKSVYFKKPVTFKEISEYLKKFNLIDG
ncbi:MAG: response regulator [Thermodesulfobacteria bacterium]|nr:response regulator [Thermodesulfobacteriota bacterium]